MKRMFRRLAGLVLSGVLALNTVPVAWAQSANTRTVSEDAVALFGRLCIATRGNPQRVVTTVLQQKLQAVPLSEDALQGKPGDVGLLVRSERGTDVQLHLTEPTTCNMRAMDSNDAVVNDILPAMLEVLADSERFTFEKVVDERRKTNAGEEHLVGYRLFWRDVGWSANLGVSHVAGDGAEVPPQVHFMLALRQTT
jgi:hypothetical protein